MMYTARESSLDRFVALDKGEFIGRAALVRQRDAGISRRLVTLKIHASEGSEALGYEGVYNAGRLVGRVTSANHAHHLGFNIGLAYVPSALARPGTQLEVPVLNAMTPVEVIEASPYDPTDARSRM